MAHPAQLALLDQVDPQDLAQLARVDHPVLPDLVPPVHQVQVVLPAAVPRDLVARVDHPVLRA